jgi:WD40 repeat protein
MKYNSMRFQLFIILCLVSITIAGCLGINPDKNSIDGKTEMTIAFQNPTPSRYIITVGISTATAVVPTDYRNLILENRNDLEKIPPGTYLFYRDWKESNNVLGLNIKTNEEIYVSKNMFSFSNDKNLVAYLDDDRKLKLFRLDSLSEEEIPLDLHCYERSWSPNDKYLTINCEDNVYAIRIEDLYVHNITSWAHPSVDSFQNPTWSPDGKWIATTYHQLNSLNSTEDSGIYLIDSGCIEQNSLCEELIGPFFPYSIHLVYSWSPDSIHIATYLHNAIQIVNTKTNETKRLIDQVSGIGGLLWSPDGDWIYFSQYIGYENTVNIYKISTQGGEPILVAEDKGDISCFYEVSE